MDFNGMDRRGFLALGGGAFITTLAGHKISTADGAMVDMDMHAKNVPVPPKVAAAEAAQDDPRGASGRLRPAPSSPSTGRRANTGSRRRRSSGTSSPPAATR